MTISPIAPHGPPVQELLPDGPGNGGPSFGDLLPDDSGPAVPVDNDPPESGAPSEPPALDPAGIPLPRPMYWPGGKPKPALQPPAPEPTDGPLPRPTLWNGGKITADPSTPVSDPAPLPRPMLWKGGKPAANPPTPDTAGIVVPLPVDLRALVPTVFPTTQFSLPSAPPAAVAAPQAWTSIDAPADSSAALAQDAGPISTNKADSAGPGTASATTTGGTPTVSPSTSETPLQPALTGTVLSSLGAAATLELPLTGSLSETGAVAAVPTELPAADSLDSYRMAIGDSRMAASTPTPADPSLDVRSPASLPIAQLPGEKRDLSAPPASASAAKSANQPADATLPEASPPPLTIAPGTAPILPTGQEAKIAAPAPHENETRPASDFNPSQVAQGEMVIPDQKSAGTPVARDLPVVNATLANFEIDTPASASPARRGSAGLAMTSAPERSRSTHAWVGETLIGAPVTGPAAVDASTAQVADTAAPGAATAHPAVPVETLLQNALRTGENLRPGGQSQMEMRVRLDGGAGDVTVRLQVANDRLQVTFQTDSPEMRKALEHGWQSFSETSSQTSTLALEKPRFESRQPDTSAGGTSGQPSFSSQQQNTPRQDASADFADELPVSTSAGPSTATRRSMPTTGQSSDGGWRGWA